jgi:hypothetical protein
MASYFEELKSLPFDLDAEFSWTRCIKVKWVGLNDNSRWTILKEELTVVSKQTLIELSSETALQECSQRKTGRKTGCRVSRHGYEGDRGFKGRHRLIAFNGGY